MFSKFINVVVISVFLVSCANMSESDCLAADWRVVGFEDGSRGLNESTIAQHREECAQYGVSPSLNDYRQGHLEGSENFCTTNNGFYIGRQGKTYKRSCPAQLEPQFLLGYRDGQTLYEFKKAANQQTKLLEANYAKIDKLERIIAQQNEQMIADGLNRTQRVAIRDNIVEYEQQQLGLIELLPELQKNFEDAVALYEEAKKRFANYL